MIYGSIAEDEAGALVAMRLLAEVATFRIADDTF
jgi:hypothetical protein